MDGYGVCRFGFRKQVRKAVTLLVLASRLSVCLTEGRTIIESGEVSFTSDRARINLRKGLPSTARRNCSYSSLIETSALCVGGQTDAWRCRS